MAGNPAPSSPLKPQVGKSQTSRLKTQTGRQRSQPQRPDDPAWNAEHCRNRRNFLDDITRRAIASDKEAMLATYGMELGEGRYLPVKNVFVPLYVAGRRWGNFEVAYRDEAGR